MKKIVALLYVALMAIFRLTGCGYATSIPEQGEQTESVSGSVAKIEALTEISAMADNQTVKDEASAESTAHTVVKDSNSFLNNTSELEITVLDVGQGLSVLMGSNGEYGSSRWRRQNPLLVCRIILETAWHRKTSISVCITLR